MISVGLALTGNNSDQETFAQVCSTLSTVRQCWDATPLQMLSRLPTYLYLCIFSSSEIYGHAPAHISARSLLECRILSLLECWLRSLLE